MGFTRPAAFRREPDDAAGVRAVETGCFLLPEPDELLAEPDELRVEAEELLDEPEVFRVEEEDFFSVPLLPDGRDLDFLLCAIALTSYFSTRDRMMEMTPTAQQ